MRPWLLHVGASLTCPHAAPVTIVTPNVRVRVSGQFVAASTDQYLVTGCPFYPGSSPSPCLTVQWFVVATRVRVNGQPAVLATSVGQCNNPAQVPQGPPIVNACQVRVRGA